MVRLSKEGELVNNNDGVWESSSSISFALLLKKFVHDDAPHVIGEMDRIVKTKTPISLF
jgi:hypothetical protein